MKSVAPYIMELGGDAPPFPQEAPLPGDSRPASPNHISCTFENPVREEMIKRIYIHNFRCLENFELPVSGLTSFLLIGRSGAGKSTVSCALQVLQSIARGTNRVGQLVGPEDLHEAGQMCRSVSRSKC